MPDKEITMFFKRGISRWIGLMVTGLVISSSVQAETRTYQAWVAEDLMISCVPSTQPQAHLTARMLANAFVLQESTHINLSIRQQRILRYSSSEGESEEFDSITQSEQSGEIQLRQKNWSDQNGLYCVEYFVTAPTIRSEP